MRTWAKSGGMAPAQTGCDKDQKEDSPAAPAPKRRLLGNKGAEVPKPKHPPNQTKRAKDIDTTETLLLTADQLFRSLGDIQTYKAVIVKQVEQLEKRVNDRLTPALINVYVGASKDRRAAPRAEAAWRSSSEPAPTRTSCPWPSASSRPCRPPRTTPRPWLSYGGRSCQE